MQLDVDVLRTLVEMAPEGVVVCDAAASDCPVVYVNAAFATMSGYTSAQLMGANLRLLQGTDRQQESRQRMKEAIDKGEPCRVLIRNYRPDGALFWNEVQLQPLKNGDGNVSHWIGYSKDSATSNAGSATGKGPCANDSE